MLYISKGMVMKQSTKQELCVTHCGVDYMLTGIGSELWLKGRFEIGESADERQDKHLKELERLGLAETSVETGPLAAYRVLTRCIICPAELKPVRRPLTAMENKAWLWIKEAGLRLTIGEMTKLFTDEIEPVSELLGHDNAQDLTLQIYQGDLMFDTTPDIEMEKSPKRDDVVTAVLGLLKKKRILLI